MFSKLEIQNIVYDQKDNSEWTILGAFGSKWISLYINAKVSSPPSISHVLNALSDQEINERLSNLHIYLSSKQVNNKYMYISFLYGENLLKPEDEKLFETSLFKVLLYDNPNISYEELADKIANYNDQFYDIKNLKIDTIVNEYYENSQLVSYDGFGIGRQNKFIILTNKDTSNFSTKYNKKICEQLTNYKKITYKKSGCFGVVTVLQNDNGKKIVMKEICMESFIECVDIKPEDIFWSEFTICKYMGDIGVGPIVYDYIFYKDDKGNYVNRIYMENISDGGVESPILDNYMKNWFLHHTHESNLLKYAISSRIKSTQLVELFYNNLAVQYKKMSKFGVFHDDLRSANVLVMDDYFYFIDYGLASIKKHDKYYVLIKLKGRTMFYTLEFPMYVTL